MSVLMAIPSAELPAGVPAAMLKRKLLYAKEIDRPEIESVIRALLKAEHDMDALAFMQKIEDRAGIESLAQTAIDRGDLFLYESCSRALGWDVKQKDLARLGTRAEALGKLHFAVKAFRLAGKEEEAEAASRLLSSLHATPERALEPGPTGPNVETEIDE